MLDRIKAEICQLEQHHVRVTRIRLPVDLMREFIWELAERGFVPFEDCFMEGHYRVYCTIVELQR